jgi:putative transcriptional regulator
MPTPSEIRAVRRFGLGLTQAAMADRLGVSCRIVQAWEYGERRMQPITWRAITRSLGKHSKPERAAIRRARRLARLSQQRAAERLGVALRTWQQWEDGDRRMPAAKWALFLDLSGLPATLTASTRLLAAPQGFY